MGAPQMLITEKPWQFDGPGSPLDEIVLDHVPIIGDAAPFRLHPRLTELF